MAYTTINKSTDYFNTKLYTGAGTSGSPFSLTGVGFAPDWTWIKRRDGASIGHRLFDRVRGATKYIDSSASSAETTNTSTLTAFGSDGFTLQNEGSVNDGSALFTSWNWKANGQGSSNTDGSINTTYTSVNTTAGFSIVSYTGNGTSGATIGHGLSSAPSMILVKSRSTTQSWIVYHKSIGATKFLRLEGTDASAVASSVWNDTAPTNSVITLGNSSGTNTNGTTYIAYCFAEKQGYSKFGSYVGANSNDGAFLYLGFKPAFIMVKAVSGSNTPGSQNWVILDNKRSSSGGNNVIQYKLFPSASDAENTAENNHADFLSNGVKFRGGNDATNGNNTYIYMAFAEAPLVGSNNTPCTAR